MGDGFTTAFERHEKKYLLEYSQYKCFLEALEGKMKQDKYGLHTICSIYYDTDDYQVIRASIDKPKYKEKLRLRSYGIPRRSDTVFLELKKKLDGITYKSRVPLTLAQAEQYVANGANMDSSQQVLGEISNFLRRHHPKPKVVLCYDRIAMFGVEDSSLRLTIDKGIRWRDYDQELAKGDYGSLLIRPDQRLMEIKVLGCFPFWLSKMLSHYKIYPSSFSKYGRVYQDYLFCKEESQLA